MRLPSPVISLRVFVCLLVVLPAGASAQPIWPVSDDASLRAAIASANPGETILFTQNITLGSELPNVGTDLTIDGAYGRDSRPQGRLVHLRVPDPQGGGPDRPVGGFPVPILTPT